MLNCITQRPNLRESFARKKTLGVPSRIRAVYLALMGKTAPQIAHVLGYTRRVVQNWVYSYNRSGLDGLNDNKGRGRKHGLNEDQIQWLRQRIEEGPRPEDKVCVFHAADIQSIIQKQFGMQYHVRSVRRLLVKLGYSYVSSRPEHPKGNPQARETFKKKSVIRLGKSVLIIMEKQ